MNAFLVVFALCCAGLIMWGLLRPERVYEFPFLAGSVFAGFVFVGLFGVSHDLFLPEGALTKMLLMSSLCAGMIFLGYIFPSASLTWFQWRFDDRRLLKAAATLTLFGAYFFHALSSVPEEMWTTQLSGLPVAYLFLADTLKYGFAISTFLAIKNRSPVALGISALGALSYIDAIILAGRRSQTLEFFFIIALSFWFAQRRSVPRIIMLSLMIVGMLGVHSTGEYRSLAAEQGTGAVKNLQTIPFFENVKEVLQNGSGEVRSAVYSIEAVDRSGEYDFGLYHWNRIIFNYLPAQLVGSNIKAALTVELPDASAEAASLFDYAAIMGTTPTGMVDAFSSFSYFGCLKFFLIALIVSKLYRAAMAGFVAPQIFYMVLLTPALHAITHNTHWFFAPWGHMALFLIPGLLWARVPSRETVEASFDWRPYATALVARWWIVALGLVLGGTWAGFYLFRKPVLYESGVLFQIEEIEKTPLNLRKYATSNLRGLGVLKTMEQDFKLRSLMQRVIDANNLTAVANFLPHQAGPKPTEEELIKFLQERTSPHLIAPLGRIYVTFDHESPKWAHDIAASLVQEFLRQNTVQRFDVTEAASDFLLGEGARLKAKFAQSEEAVRQFRIRTGAATVEDQRKMAEAKLRNSDRGLTEATQNRIQLEQDCAKAAQAQGNVEALLAIPSVAGQQTIKDLQAKVVSDDTELAGLRQRYKGKHPKMLAANATAERDRLSLREAVLQSPEGMARVLERARTTEEGARKNRAEEEKAVMELDRKLVPYAALVRDMESDKTLYDKVIRGVKEARIALGMESQMIRIIEPAYPPYRVHIPKGKIIVVALMGGFLAGCGIVAALCRWDGRVRSVDDAERLFHLPVLGAIPRVRREEKGKIFWESAPAAAEEFRSLRAALSLQAAAGDHSVCLFVSAEPGEGKTTLSTNYAISLAQQGYSTLLIDGDLRRPSAGKLLLEQKGGPGLSDCLLGEATLEGAAIPAATDGLSVLPAGKRAPNPAELFTSKRFPALLAEARQKYDRVIVDTAPLNPVSDTLTILKQADVVSLVVKTNSTSRRAIDRALLLLRRAGVEPAGIVLNQVPQRTGVGYYYHYGTPAYGNAAYAATTKTT